MAKKSFRDICKEQKEDLVKRHQESIDRKDEGRGGTIFIPEKIPEGVTLWRQQKAEHIFDIIPYLAGSQHPKDPEGKVSYVVDVYVHRGVGAMNEQFVCPAYNFKKPCPMCEYITRENLTKEQWRKVRPVRYVAYLIWVHDTPEEEKKGIQLLYCPHFFMEEKLDAQAKMPRGGAPIAFADPDNGKSVFFEIKGKGSFEDAEGNKRESLAWEGHKLIDRTEPIPDEILDQSFPLDSIIKIHPSYDEIYQAFYGEEYKKGEAPPEKMGDKKEEIPEPSSSAEEDTTPPPPEERVSPEEDPETEPSTEEDPEPSSDDKCPHGGTFGVDVEKLPECGPCRLWQECSDEADRRAKKGGALKEEDESKKEESKTRLRRRRNK